MKFAQIGLLWLTAIVFSGCSSLPPYGQGTYGFFAPDGVSPEVVAGYVWWEIDPPDSRGFRGLLWLERPLIDEPNADSEDGDTLPFFDYDDLRQVASDQFLHDSRDFGIFALQSDRTAKPITLSEDDARTILEEIRVHKHLRPESSASEIFRGEIAPHLTALHTPLTWHHGRNADSPYWVPQKFRERVP